MAGSSLDVHEATPDDSMLGSSDSKGLLDALLIGVGGFETLGLKYWDYSLEGPWLGTWDIKVGSSLERSLTRACVAGQCREMLEGT